MSRSFRVDYLKIWLSGTPSAVISEKVWLAEVLQSEGNTNGYGAKPFKSTPSYKATTEVWVEMFECWGPQCDKLARLLTPAQWAGVSRVDYREEIDEPPVSLLRLEQMTRDVSQGGLSVNRYTSRPRTKRGGRDAGGEGIGLGAHSSDRRVTVYKRGRDPWAVELQVSGKMALAAIAEARRRFDSQDVHDFYLAVVLVLSDQLAQQFLKRTGLPYAVFTGEEPYASTDALVAVPGGMKRLARDMLADVTDELGLRQTMFTLCEIYDAESVAQLAILAVDDELAQASGAHYVE